MINAYYSNRSIDLKLKCKTAYWPSFATPYTVIIKVTYNTHFSLFSLTTVKIDQEEIPVISNRILLQNTQQRFSPGSSRTSFSRLVVASDQTAGVFCHFPSVHYRTSQSCYLSSKVRKGPEP